ncbi:hypothetical protein Taro_019901 [Colocasia esculenta]|uniref:Uncharacterized protein n=1 Tax=Colocasia esculenta TaxID=4460 RepID=A0A843V6Y4_COLES|nr:hypothetical protein [Colocasia esculenta]
MAGERPSLLPVVGPDGLARDAPVISYTEKIIEEGQLQLKQLNVCNIVILASYLIWQIVNRPKVVKMSHQPLWKYDFLRQAWEAAAKIVKDEEAAKQKLSDDLNQLVQESAATQFSRLEELKRRLEALNPSRASTEVPIYLLLGISEQTKLPKCAHDT